MLHGNKVTNTETQLIRQTNKQTEATKTVPSQRSLRWSNNVSFTWCSLVVKNAPHVIENTAAYACNANVFFYMFCTQILVKVVKRRIFASDKNNMNLVQPASL